MARLLTNMKIRAVALVDKGANKRRFFLLKSEKDQTMKKEIAIELLKSAKHSPETVSAIVNATVEADRVEVETFSKSAEFVEIQKNADEIETIIEKAGAKFSKATAEQLKTLSDSVAKMQTILTDLTKGLQEQKPIKAEKTPEEIAADVAAAEAAAKDPEVSEETFKAMLKTATENIGA